MNKEIYQLFCSWFKSRYSFISDDVLNWLYCMSYLETGNFSSCIFNENYNLFGMKAAKSRISTVHGVNRNHALYTNCIESIDDLMFWFCYNRFYQTDFLDIHQFVRRFSRTSYNPKMESYVSSINQLFIKFFSYDGTI